jgi:hypothetical protein
MKWIMSSFEDGPAVVSSTGGVVSGSDFKGAVASEGSGTDSSEVVVIFSATAPDKGEGGGFTAGGQRAQPNETIRE